MSKPTIVVIVVLVLMAALFAGGLVIGGGQGDDSDPPDWMEWLGGLFGPPGEPLDFRTEVDYSPKSVRPKRDETTLTIPKDVPVELTIRPSDEEHRSARLAWVSGGKLRVVYVPRDAGGSDGDAEPEDLFLESGADPVKLVVLGKGGLLTLQVVAGDAPVVIDVE